jgi:hypothetical protein
MVSFCFQLLVYRHNTRKSIKYSMLIFQQALSYIEVPGSAGFTEIQ